MPHLGPQNFCWGPSSVCVVRSSCSSQDLVHTPFLQEASPCPSKAHLISFASKILQHSSGTCHAGIILSLRFSWVFAGLFRTGLHHLSLQFLINMASSIKLLLRLQLRSPRAHIEEQRKETQVTGRKCRRVLQVIKIEHQQTQNMPCLYFVLCTVRSFRGGVSVLMIFYLYQHPAWCLGWLMHRLVAAPILSTMKK